MAAALSFVKIRDNQITLENTPFPTNTDTSKLRVLSILGKARMGKSTFLNAIATSIKGSSITPFATQDNDEHCTRGVDAFYIAERDLLLLDFQGLSLEDSSHDPALLLFAYCISDMLIFNERMMLQNEALKLLEPICAFMQYIDEETPKPQLYFRISDGDIVKDPGKNLDKVMATYNDQYQSIRDSIRTLFKPDIGIVKTDTLDRAVKAQVQAGNYTKLLEHGLFGFPEVIGTILQSIPPHGHNSQQWWSQIPTIIQRINTNEKITIDKLDVVGQTGKLELLEWIHGLSANFFRPLTVNGFQDNFEAVVEPRKLEKRNTLTAFTRKFKTVSETLKAPHYRQLAARFQETIEVAEKECTKKAETHLAPLIRKAEADFMFPTLNSLTGRISTIPDTYWTTTYFAQYEALRAAAAKVYAPVCKKWLTWVDAQEAVVRNAVKKMCEEEAAEQAALVELRDAHLATFEANTLEELTLSAKDLEYTNAEILDRTVQSTVNLFIEQGLPKIQYRSMTAKQTEKHIHISTAKHSFSREAFVVYEAVRDIKLTLETGLREKVQEEQTLFKHVTDLKEAALIGKYMCPTHPLSTIIKKNPHIEFVKDEMLFKVSGRNPDTIWVTRATYNNVILPIYQHCLAKLREKGFVTADYTLDRILGFGLAAKKDTNLPTFYYDNYVWNTFHTYKQKEFMRRSVGGLGLEALTS